MKKISAVILSAALAACGMTAVSSNAAGSGYSPRLYIEADRSENFDLLQSGKIYINTSETQDSEISLNGRVYIDDKRDNAGMVFIKWRSKYDGIKLTEFVNPFDIAGAAAYAEYETPEQIGWSHNEKENFMGVAYICNRRDADGHMLTLTFTGERSDDYPVGGFKASVDTSIPAGNYEIDFMNEGSNRCDVLYRFGDEEIDEAFPTGNYAKGLKIGISDRKLGDVDGTGKHEAYDASMVLSAYAMLSGGMDTGLTDAQLVAADVDGDGVITAADAGLILSYYTYLAGGGNLSIADFQY